MKYYIFKYKYRSFKKDTKKTTNDVSFFRRYKKNNIKNIF